MDDKEKIENCYCQMYGGMIDRDRVLLSEVLGESFILVHMTGMQQSKNKFIQAIEDGTLIYYSVNHQHIETKIWGDQAELTGQSVVDAAVFGGGRHTWRLQLKLELTRKSGTWHIMKAKASTY